MAWKFYNIAKANARVDELEAELASAKAGKAPAPSDDKFAALEQRITELAASIAALGDQVSTIQSSTTGASDKFAVEMARIDKALGDVTPEKIGSRIAAEITARQGQAPLNLGGGSSSNNGQGNDLLAQFAAITDPAKKTEWYRKNKDAYDAAWSAAQQRK